VFVTKSSFLSVFILFLTCSLGAQEIEGKSARQLKSLAEIATREGDPETASIFYVAYLEKRPEDFRGRYRLAMLQKQLGNYKAASDNFQLLSQSRAEKYPLAAFYYAEMLRSTGNCEEAIPVYKDFRSAYRGKKDDRKYLRLAKNAVNGCEQHGGSQSAAQLAIIHLPGTINGPHIEGAPIFMENGDLLYNSLVTEGKTTFSPEEEELPTRSFYRARKEGGEWNSLGIWEVLKDLEGEEIANGAFNPDRTRFYFSLCKTNLRGKVDCDIYRVNKTESGWSKAERLSEEVNSSYTETQVAVGIDEKERETIYFVTDRKDGKGGTDIWYTTYDAKRDRYKKARNCGSKVNSVGDEVTPFVNPLNRKLYFSSDGHPGNGGLDVFQAAGQRSRWTEPENIGSEVNSPADELYYVRHPNGTDGVFASNRLRSKNDPKGFCCDDLYYFKNLNQLNLSLELKVKEKDGGLQLKEANVKLYEKDTLSGELFLLSSSQLDNQEPNLALEANRSYVLKVEKEGFLAEEKELKTYGINSDRSYSLSFSLEKYKDKNILVKNIVYEFNSSELTKKAMTRIDTTIYKTLMGNPHIIVEIGSHTDSKGTEAYNRHLSQERAESVVKYLRSKGIARNRMTARGYGESVPIAPNTNPDGSDNPEGRAMNRRTEFKVIGEVDPVDEDDD
jgi:outer membrane protein OmpA-like peptidoglycan-associated protein